MLIHSAPEPMLPARDADHNLIEMPLVSDGRQPPTDLVGEALAELHRPLPHGLMADQDAAGGQHLLDHAQAQGEPVVQPNRVADDFSREAVASIVRRTGGFHSLPMPVSRHL
jgi:hypothetical protein